jgi:ribosome-associated toxin RatA of RatAB toxin-antitoxin module
MAQAEHRETLSVPKDKLFAAITRYEDYPQFVEGCTKVEVQRKGPGQARVTYHVSMMKDIVYTLDHREDAAAGVVEWSLVDSDAIKQNTGRWTLKDAGAGKTDATYNIEIDFKFPVPGFILNRLVKGSLPSMVKSFAKKAASS